MIIWPAKPPGATAAYSFDFSAFLAADETISGTPVIAPDGVTLAAGPTVNGPKVDLELSGGTAGTVAKVTCTITTSTGEIWPELAVVAINGEAVSLADAKTAQKIEADDEDQYLAGLLRAAVGYVERACAKNLTAKIETQTVDGFPGCVSRPGQSWSGWGSQQRNDPGIRLWRGPVSEIVSVKYDDSDGVEQTLSSFRLVEGANAKLLPAYGEYWPATVFGPGSVRLTYIAGYDPTELPPELTLAAILLFGHWNANREAAIASDRAAAVELPLGVEEMIAPYRTPGIA